MGKCLKDIQGVTLKMVRWDLLGDPPSKNKGITGVKIGIVDKRKSGLALERGRTKLIGQCRVLQGTGNLTREIRNLNGYVGW